MISAGDKPRLMPGCRLSEAANEPGTLMVPEGAMRLNPSALAIVELCNGVRTFAAIVASLQEAFPAAAPERLEADAADMLEKLRTKRVVSW
ncbi:MAG TPA: pyrroloquinoline quinone biosynthesis peptide chaperone PqqD [Terriglobales bacterium]|nr:pyrroloquinoline quinone biosynthesis peptide chaperone PqqD [Terriglobales bacterium]